MEKKKWYLDINVFEGFVFSVMKALKKMDEIEAADIVTGIYEIKVVAKTDDIDTLVSNIKAIPGGSGGAVRRVFASQSITS